MSISRKQKIERGIIEKGSDSARLPLSAYKEVAHRNKEGRSVRAISRGEKNNQMLTTSEVGSLGNRRLPSFVVQEHYATNLHYDFRLEMNKKLKSWALPKIPPIRTKIKRLAIQVPDHELSYAKFEGIIKEGYGKGEVKIWDEGQYDLLYKGKDKIEFELFGKKLKGKYVLVNAKMGKDKKNWLFFKVG